MATSSTSSKNVGGLAVLSDTVSSADYPITAAAIITSKDDLELVVHMRKLEDMYKDLKLKYDNLKVSYSHLENMLADPLFQPGADEEDI